MDIDAFKKFDLTGKTAVVTGGATGLGYYMTRGLMRSGAKVMMAARRENVLKEAAETLRAETKSGEILYHTVDLNQRDTIKTFSEHAIKTMGGVDIFIGNAGQDIFEQVDKITDPVIDQMFQVNVSSNMELMRDFLPHMRKNKWGRVLFSSSGTSINTSAQEGMGVYAATKSALNAFARSAAAETGHDGITVNSIVLGMYMTPMLADHLAMVEKTHPGASKAFTDSFGSMTAIGRLGRCDEIEGLIQLLASNAGSYITGGNIVPDGGLTIMLRPNQPPENPIYPPPF